MENELLKIIDVLKDFVIADSAGKMELYLNHPNIEFDESLGYISSDCREPFTITFANKLADYLKLRLSNTLKWKIIPDSSSNHYLEITYPNFIECEDLVIDYHPKTNRVLIHLELNTSFFYDNFVVENNIHLNNYTKESLKNDIDRLILINHLAINLKMKRYSNVHTFINNSYEQDFKDFIKNNPIHKEKWFSTKINTDNAIELKDFLYTERIRLEKKIENDYLWQDILFERDLNKRFPEIQERLKDNIVPIVEKIEEFLSGVGVSPLLKKEIYLEYECLSFDSYFKHYGLHEGYIFDLNSYRDKERENRFNSKLTEKPKIGSLTINYESLLK